MPESLIVLSYFDLALAGLMILVSTFLSWRLQLGVERDLIWGGVRAFVQLALVGFVLGFIFKQNQWYWVAIALFVMLAMAAHTANGRVKDPLAGKWWALSFAIVCGSLIVLIYVLGVVMRIPTWYEPQFVLPLAGMIIGNGMNAATLAISRFLADMRIRRAEVETALSLGATAAQASLPLRRDALRAAIIPSVNTMLIVGVVSLPGMMTGQILAGGDPTQAARYQIMAMYMITTAAALTSLISIALFSRLIFTSEHQLRG